MPEGFSPPGIFHAYNEMDSSQVKEYANRGIIEK
jgi:hypothetical protein